MNRNGESKIFTYGLVLVGCWTVVVILGIMCVHFAGLESGTDSILARFGQMGDSFGTLNSLVSSLAVFAAIATLVSQKEQLKEQQEQYQHQLSLENEKMRRDKLESALQMLSDASVATADICATIQQSFTADDIKRVLNEFGNQELPVRVILALYFPGLEEHLEITRFHYLKIAATWGRLSKGRAVTSKERDEVLRVINSRHSYLTMFTRMAIMNSKNIINDPNFSVKLESKSLNHEVIETVKKEHGHRGYYVATNK